MQTAYIEAAHLQFPDRCVRCDRAPVTTHLIDARRTVIDVLWLAYWQFLEIPVPVCLRCKRIRRAGGIALWVGSVVLILAGGFVAMQLVMAEWKVAAGVLGATVLIFCLALRFLGDELLEWTTLGVVIELLKGTSNPLRLRFRRPEFFTAWRDVNPGAASSWQQPLTTESPMTTAATPSSNFSRRTPAISLVATMLLIALHHWWAVTQREMYPKLLLGMFLFGGLAIGGTIYPPLFYSWGKYGTHLPKSLKVLAAVCAAGGFALGFYLMLTLYE